MTNTCPNCGTVIVAVSMFVFASIVTIIILEPFVARSGVFSPTLFLLSVLGITGVFASVFIKIAGGKE